jgi:hypothetical protein
MTERDCLFATMVTVYKCRTFRYCGVVQGDEAYKL